MNSPKDNTAITDAAFDALLLEGAAALARLDHWQAGDLRALLGDEAAAPLQKLLESAVASRDALLEESAAAE